MAGVSVTLSDLYPSLLDACGTGDLNLVKYLLNEGLDVNHVDGEGKFPLLVASSFGKLEIVKFLLEHGAIVDLLNSRKEPSVFKGSHSDWSKVVGLLKEYGAKDGVLLQPQTSIIFSLPASEMGEKNRLDSEVSLPEAIQQTFPLTPKWLNIGVLLGIPVSILETIKHDNYQSHDCLREILSVWLKRATSPPTWRKLLDAIAVIDPYSAEKIRLELLHK